MRILEEDPWETKQEDISKPTTVRTRVRKRIRDRVIVMVVRDRVRGTFQIPTKIQVHVKSSRRSYPSCRFLTETTPSDVFAMLSFSSSVEGETNKCSYVVIRKDGM